MKRIVPGSLACTAILLLAASLPPSPAAATPNPNSAVVKERIFNDCPFTTLTVVNNYPSLISFEDVGSRITDHTRFFEGAAFKLTQKTPQVRLVDVADRRSQRGHVFVTQRPRLIQQR